MNIDGSATLRCHLCCWSPDGSALATVSTRCRLIVRHASSLEVIFSELCSSSTIHPNDWAIDKIGFSPDSQLVFASALKAGITFIFSVNDRTGDGQHPAWRAKINEGPAGCSDIQFCPDSRHLLSLAEFSVKLTLWSLVQKKVRYIKYPKSLDCVKFSHARRDKSVRFLGVVERRNGHDCVSVFSCDDWTMKHHFESESVDCHELCWSPSEDLICLASSLLIFTCHVYSLDGHCVFSYCHSPIGLGLAKSVWSPCGSVLLLAGCDGSLRLFNSSTWAFITELEHSHVVSDPLVHLYQEQELPVQDIDAEIVREFFRGRPETSYNIVRTRPFKMQHTTVRKTASERKCRLDFQASGTFFCVMFDFLPTTIWIWNLRLLKLDSVLVHQSPVVSALWGPPHSDYADSLMVLTDDGGLKVWSPYGCAGLSLPVSAQLDGAVQEVHWNSRGRAVALLTKDSVVCCRLGQPIP